LTSIVLLWFSFFWYSIFSQPVADYVTKNTAKRIIQKLLILNVIEIAYS